MGDRAWARALDASSWRQEIKAEWDAGAALAAAPAAAPSDAAAAWRRALSPAAWHAAATPGTPAAAAAAAGAAGGGAGAGSATPASREAAGSEQQEEADEAEDGGLEDPTREQWQASPAHGADEIVNALRDRAHRQKKRLYAALAHVGGISVANRLRAKRNGEPVGTGPKLTRADTSDLLAWAALSAPLPACAPDATRVPLRWVRSGAWRDAADAAAAVARARALVQAARDEALALRGAAAALLAAAEAAAAPGRRAAAEAACRLAKPEWRLDEDAADALARSPAAAAHRARVEEALQEELPQGVLGLLWVAHVAESPDYCDALLALEAPGAAPHVEGVRPLRALLRERGRPPAPAAPLATEAVPALLRPFADHEFEQVPRTATVDYAWFKDRDVHNWPALTVAVNRHLVDPLGGPVPLAQDLAVHQMYVPVPVLVSGSVKSLGAFPAAAWLERVPPPAVAAQLSPFGRLPRGCTAANAWDTPAVAHVAHPSPAVLRALVDAAYQRRGAASLKGNLSAAEWEVNAYVRMAYLWDFAHARRYFARLPGGQHVVPVLVDDAYSPALKACSDAGGGRVRVQLDALGAFVAHVVCRRVGAPLDTRAFVASRHAVEAAVRFARALVGDDDDGGDPLAVNRQGNARDMLHKLGFVPFPVVSGARGALREGCSKRVRTVHVDVSAAVSDGSVLYGHPRFRGDAPLCTLGHVIGANARFAHFLHADSAPVHIGGGTVLYDALDALDRVRMLFGMCAPSTGKGAIKQVFGQLGGRRAVVKSVTRTMRDTQLMFACSSSPCAAVVATRDPFPFVDGHCEPHDPRAPTMVDNYKRLDGAPFMAAMTDDARARFCGTSRKAAPLPLPDAAALAAARRAGAPPPLVADAAAAALLEETLAAHGFAGAGALYRALVAAPALAARVAPAADGWTLVARNSAFAVLRRAPEPRSAGARAREQVCWDVLAGAADPAAALRALALLPDEVVYARPPRATARDPLALTEADFSSVMRARQLYRHALFPEARARAAAALARALGTRVSAPAHGWLLVDVEPGGAPLADGRAAPWRLDQLLRAAALSASDANWRFHAARCCLAAPPPPPSVFAAPAAERAVATDALGCAALELPREAVAAYREWRDERLRDAVKSSLAALDAPPEWKIALNVDDKTVEQALTCARDELTCFATAAELSDLTLNAARLLAARAAADAAAGRISREAAQEVVWFAGANAAVAEDDAPLERLPAAADTPDGRAFALLFNACLAFLQGDPTAERPSEELLPSCGLPVVFRHAVDKRPGARADAGGCSQALLAQRRALVAPASLGLARPLRVDTPEEVAQAAGKRRRDDGADGGALAHAAPARAGGLLFGVRYLMRLDACGAAMSAYPVLTEQGAPEFDAGGRVRVLCQVHSSTFVRAPLALLAITEPGAAAERLLALDGKECGAAPPRATLYSVKGVHVRVDERADGGVEAVQLLIAPPPGVAVKREPAY